MLTRWEMQGYHHIDLFHIPHLLFLHLVGSEKWESGGKPIGFHQINNF